MEIFGIKDRDYVYAKTIAIGDNVWICTGVLAYGVQCKVIRPINKVDGEIKIIELFC